MSRKSSICQKVAAAFKFARLVGVVALCLGLLTLAYADSAQSKHKPKKQELPPLPSGPTGPVPPIPLDAIAPVAPQVTYQDGLLTIIANNSTLGDILKAVRKQTAAEIDIPDAKERVVTHLGPAPAREVIAALLNGSRFNYVLLGAASDPNALARVVLVAKTTAVNAGSAQPQQFAQRPMNQPGMAPGETPRDDAAEMNSEDDTTEDAPPVQAEQPPPPAQSPDQPEAKTPQQLLQEMQQRQLQIQQQQQGQQPGNPPAPPPQQQ